MQWNSCVPSQDHSSEELAAFHSLYNLCTDDLSTQDRAQLIGLVIQASHDPECTVDTSGFQNDVRPGGHHRRRQQLLLHRQENAMPTALLNASLHNINEHASVRRLQGMDITVPCNAVQQNAVDSCVAACLQCQDQEQALMQMVAPLGVACTTASGDDAAAVVQAAVDACHGLPGAGTYINININIHINNISAHMHAYIHHWCCHGIFFFLFYSWYSVQCTVQHCIALDA
jgi:hypothetical protein